MTKQQVLTVGALMGFPLKITATANDGAFISTRTLSRDRDWYYFREIANDRDDYDIERV